MGREANENLYFCANPDFSGLGMASTESGVTTGLQLFFFQEPRIDSATILKDEYNEVTIRVCSDKNRGTAAFGAGRCFRR